MRGPNIIARKTRNILISECNLTPEFLSQHYGFAKAEYLEINSFLGRYGDHLRFGSIWRLRAFKRWKDVRALSAGVVSGVQDERNFDMLDRCDATNGFKVLGPLSKTDTQGDKERLVRALRQILAEAPTGRPGLLRIMALRNRLRITVDAATRILDVSRDPERIVNAAIPHFAAQASAARAWLEDASRSLMLDTSGFSIITRL